MNYTAPKLASPETADAEATAVKIGISISFIGHIERGSRTTSLATLVAICNTLEVSPEHLLCDSLVPTACNASANVTEQGVLQLRKKLYDALVIVDRMGGE